MITITLKQDDAGQVVLTVEPENLEGIYVAALLAQATSVIIDGTITAAVKKAAAPPPA